MIPARSLPVLIVSILAVALVGWMAIQTDSQMRLYRPASSAQSVRQAPAVLTRHDA